jgi:glycosyltransferase involved in cell wall biosynthesis
VARSILLSNAGVNPEMARCAAGLAADGTYRTRYATSLSFTADEWVVRLLRRPPLRSTSVSGLLQRRVLPTGLSRNQLERVATTHEIAFKILHRLPVRYHEPPMRWRTNVFDRRVSRRLVRDADLLLVQATGALFSLREARRLGIPTLLNCPIAHHRWCSQYLEDQRLKWPDWSETLQWDTINPHLERRLDQEIQLADRLLVLSNWSAQTFIDSGVPEDKIGVTPLGVDIGAFPPRTRRTVDGVPFRVLYVGQITQRKGVADLIDAFRTARLPRGSELLLVGRATPSARRLLSGDGIRWAGHVSRHELPRLLATADAFASPSLVEGFSQAVTEAMSSGLPVVITPNTGHDEVSDRGEGLVVPAGDAQRLRLALEQLAEDDELRTAMGTRASLKAAELTWDRYVARVQAEMRRLGFGDR